MKTQQQNGTNGHGEVRSESVRAATAGTTQIGIPSLKLGIVTFAIEGVSPLIMHAFPQKIASMMLDKHKGKARQKRDPKVPEDDFLAALHHFGKPPQLVVAKKADIQGPLHLHVSAKGRWGFPAGGIRSAAVSACRQVDGLKMTFARGVFQVVADEPGNNFVEIFGTPIMRQDVVRNQTGVPDIRFRAHFQEWSAKLTLKYDSKCITPEQLANLYNQAGFSVGLGDWRPERSGGFGMFRVAETGEFNIRARS